VEQLEARARQATIAHERQADVIDAKVPAQEAERLQAEQDAFRGIDRTSPSADGPRQVPPAPSSSATTPAEDDQHNPEGIAAPEAHDATSKGDDSTPGAPKSGGVGGIFSPSQSPVPTNQHTDAEWIEFLSEREYWIGEDGEPWRVEVSDDGIAALYRDDDPDSVVQPPRIGSAADDIARRQGESTRAGAPGDGGSKPSKSSPIDHGFDASQHADHGGEAPLGMIGGGRGGAPDQLPPADSSSSSGVQYLYSDGRTVSSIRETERWDSGVDRTTIQRSSQGSESDQNGYESLRITRASRPDGSSAEIRNGVQSGVYDRQDSETPGMVGMARSYSTTRTVGADGSIRSTDSRRPSPRPTPTTIDELRTAQDELGIATDAVRDGGERPQGVVDGVFHDTQIATARIDVDELQRAAQQGAIDIARTDPDAMEQYADASFDEVRSRFAELGLDADAGNEQIDRDWLSDDPNVFNNAAYFAGTDEMKFGSMDDGTPFAASDDVIAHEFTHRIIQHNGGVNYEGESGAINESLSDTMAMTIDTEDWLVGEDVMPGGVRDMSIPATMDDFLDTREDHGGVHTNSAIPNYAAYLIGDELGRDDMGRIYARTMDQYLSQDMEFTDLAEGTWRAAVDLYGETSSEAAAVREVWDGVLLLDGDTTIYEQ
jgi:hypothetical protein